MAHFVVYRGRDRISSERCDRVRGRRRVERCSPALQRLMISGCSTHALSPTMMQLIFLLLLSFVVSLHRLVVRQPGVQSSVRPSQRPSGALGRDEPKHPIERRIHSRAMSLKQPVNRITCTSKERANHVKRLEAVLHARREEGRDDRFGSRGSRGRGRERGRLRLLALELVRGHALVRHTDELRAR